jgi:hypothetical protein
VDFDEINKGFFFRRCDLFTYYFPNKRIPLFPGVRFHLGVNYFTIQFYVGTRGLLSYVSKPILPISILQSTEMALVATQ